MHMGLKVKSSKKLLVADEYEPMVLQKTVKLRGQ